MIEKRSIQTEQSESKSSKKLILILLLTLLTGGATYTGLAFTVLLPKYTISFNTNGGSIEEPIKFDGKSSINLPSSTKVGYKLDGWYLDNEDYINKVENDYFIEHNINKNTTLYAKWNLGTFTSLDGTIEYENNGTSVSLTHVIDDSATEVVIPSVIDSLPVNDIGEDAFKDNTKLEKVTIEPGLTYINANAFKGCTSLVQITIPETVVYIGDNAFENTSLSIIVIPNSVKGIGSGAFQNNALLESITISNEISQFGNSLFRNCPNLKTISQNTPISGPTSSIEGANFSTRLTTIGDNVFKDDISLEYINIPSSVSSIGDNAFENIGATSIVIPNSVTKLGKGLFSGSSSLISVTLPSSLTIISEKMFLNCTSLTTINNSSIGGPSLEISSDSSELTIPDGIVTIEKNAFDGCSAIESIKMSNSVTRIEPSAFSNCALLSNIQLSNRLDTIEEYLFANDISLTSFTIPSNIISLKDHAFSETRITELIIPSTVLFISKGSLAELNNLTTLSSPFIGMARGHDISAYIGWFFGADSFESNHDYLPVNFTDYSLTSSEVIGDYAFNGASQLINIDVKKSKKIGEYAFKGCSSLVGADLGSATEIGIGAFQNTSIEWLSLNFIGSGTNKTWIGWIFGSDSKESNNDYIPTSFSTLGFNGTTFGDYAFYGLTKNISINSSNTLESIGAHSFEKNTTITEIPVNTKKIGDYAFYDCSQLATATNLSYTESIGDYAFAKCTTLSSVTNIGKVKEIGTYAFSDDTSLTEIALPAGVTEIKEGTFTRSQITNISTESTSLAIGKYAFKDAKRLAFLDNSFLNKLTSLGESAFDGCTRLLGVSFPAASKLKKVDANAFANCPTLSNVVLPNSVTEIGSGIFKNSGYLTSISVPFIGQFAAANSDNKKFIWFFTDDPAVKFLTTNILLVSVTNESVVAPYTFEGVALEKVAYGSQLKTIEQYGFAKSGIHDIELPSGLSIINKGAFSGNSNLTQVTIPSPQTIGKVEGYLFSDCISFKTLYAFTSAKIIPEYCYANSGVALANLSSVKSIGEGAFSNCSELVGFSWGANSITEIPAKAFKNCTKLFSVTLNDGIITYVGEGAFEGCTGLSSFNAINANLRTEIGILKGCVSLQELRVATLGATIATHSTGYLARFFGSTDKTVNTVKQIPDNLERVILIDRTSIPTYAFAFARGLKSVQMSPSITEISDHAYHGDGNLTSVPSGITKIGNYAFSDCSSITSISLTSITTLGESAFSGCNKLGNVTIPSAITEIKKNTFNGCTSFNSVTIPNTVTTVGDYAYYSCSGVSSLSISNKLTSAGRFCFGRLTTLASVTIPDSLNVYPDYMFADCFSLKTITMKKTGQTSFGAYAFAGTRIIVGLIPYTVQYIGKGVFKDVPLKELNLPITGDSRTNPTATNFSWVFGNDAVLNRPADSGYVPSSLKIINCGDISRIPDYAFYRLDSVEYISLSRDSIRSIGRSAFQGCTSLKQIADSYKIGTNEANFNFLNIETISSNAFEGCSNLEQITFSGWSLKKVDPGAFSGCSKLDVSILEEPSLDPYSVFFGARSFRIVYSSGQVYYQF